MPRLGTQFELVVADVVKEMDPGATVNHGEWVEGPDGRREIDVKIKGKVDSVTRLIQIECRDYNPKNGPIGINHIDALESKHRDLNLDVSLLCSNAGFTSGAISKAKRKGIGLIAVLREEDERIRYRVMDEIYIRRLDFKPNSLNVKFDFHGKLPPQGDLRLDEILYKKLPVLSWVNYRIREFLVWNPVVKGTFRLSFQFKIPIELTFRNRKSYIKKIYFDFGLSGKWIKQRVEIDATCGLYDWIRQTIRLSPEPCNIVYKDVTFGKGGTPIKCHPNLELVMKRELEKGEILIWLMDLQDLGIPKKIPNLDTWVMEKDLIEMRDDLPKEAYYS